MKNLNTIKILSAAATIVLSGAPYLMAQQAEAPDGAKPEMSEAQAMEALRAMLAEAKAGGPEKDVVPLGHFEKDGVEIDLSKIIVDSQKKAEERPKGSFVNALISDDESVGNLMIVGANIGGSQKHFLANVDGVEGGILSMDSKLYELSDAHFDAGAMLEYGAKSAEIEALQEQMTAKAEEYKAKLAKLPKAPSIQESVVNGKSYTERLAESQKYAVELSGDTTKTFEERKALYAQKKKELGLDGNSAAPESDAVKALRAEADKLKAELLAIKEQGEKIMAEVSLSRESGNLVFGPKKQVLIKDYDGLIKDSRAQYKAVPAYKEMAGAKMLADMMTSLEDLKNLGHIQVVMTSTNGNSITNSFDFKNLKGTIGGKTVDYFESAKSELDAKTSQDSK